uniref:Uncharacterized protein n=1 Tax=Setaria italica TaxID=4555 RepID=K3YK69_SETIT
MKSSFTKIPNYSHTLHIVQHCTTSLVIKLQLATVRRRQCPPAPPSSSSCRSRSHRRRRPQKRASCGRSPRIAWRRRRRGRRGRGRWAPCSSAPRTRRRPRRPGTGTAAAARNPWLLSADHDTHAPAATSLMS